MPYEVGRNLQTQISYRVAIAVDVVLTTTFHVLLANAHEIEHRGGIIKLHINRECLHEHSQRMSETAVSTSVIHGVEERFLLTIEAC